MSVPAESNEPGPHLFYRTVPTSFTSYGAPYGDRAETGETQEFYHWCDRSGVSSGNRIGANSRGATNFSRAVCHITEGIRTDVTTLVDARDGVTVGGWTRTGPLGVDLGQISAQSSGRIESYFVKSDEDAIAQAVTQAMNKLGDQKVNISQSVAEGRRTYSMLANSSVTLWSLYLAAKRRNWSKVAELLGKGNKTYRRAADNWLQLQYGWLPLLSDIHGTYQWFTDVDENSMLVTGQSSNTRTHVVKGETLYSSWSGSITCVGYAKYVGKITGNYARSANKGGLVNPLSLAWEVLPYSFVTDWFVPVGNVLQAYSDSAGLTFMYGYSGSSNNAEVEYTHSSHFDDGSTIDEDGKAKVKYFSHHRAAVGGFPIPRFYSVHDPFNTTRGLNALALYAQATSGSRR